MIRGVSGSLKGLVLRDISDYIQRNSKQGWNSGIKTIWQLKAVQSRSSVGGWPLFILRVRWKTAIPLQGKHRRDLSSVKLPEGHTQSSFVITYFRILQKPKGQSRPDPSAKNKRQQTVHLSD